MRPTQTLTPVLSVLDAEMDIVSGSHKGILFQAMHLRAPRGLVDQDYPARDPHGAQLPSFPSDLCQTPSYIPTPTPPFSGRTIGLLRRS